MKRRGPGVTRATVVAQQQLPSAAGEDQRRVQPRRTAADNDDVEHILLNCKLIAKTRDR